MKNKIINIIILSLIFIILSYIVILLLGKTYTLKYNLINENYKDITIENDTGEIEIIDKKIKNGNYLVKVKAKKPGKAYVYLNYEDYKEGKMIYIHKNMVITDNNYLGKSTGSEIIPISFTAILLYVFYLLKKKYKKGLKENLYQYKNIAYLGILIFLSFFIINNFLSIFSYHGLFETINKVIDSISSTSLYLFPISIITFVLVTISNINLILKEGKSIRNLLGLFLGIFICFFTILPEIIYRVLMQSGNINIYNLNGPGPYIYNFLESLIYLTITYLECILLATIIIAIKSTKKKIDYNKDYMIILGCKIKDDGTLPPLLKGRVDKAINFRNKQLEKTKKDLVFVPSGGKGKDEVISEGEAISNYLLEQGIKKDNIIVENKSKNTYENIKNSYKLINNKKANIGFSTTNYHVLRAGLIATEQGLIVEGIGSKTKSYFWINAFIREFIGTIYNERKKHIISFIIIAIIILVMILLTYLGNNL